jgi:hypothetical protein
MPAPFEIIAAPFTAWWAPVGTTFPQLGTAPAASWIMIGTSGDRNYAPEGVSVEHSQAVSMVRPLGSTAPVKAFRTEEDMVVTFTVWDLTLEQYRVAHSFVEITTTAAGVGTPGTKSLQLYRGRNLGEMALLIRGDVSPYGEGMSMQYEIPYCFMSGNPKPVLRKGEPAGIELTFTLMRNPSAVTAEQSFGRLVQQYQQPLP